jgi:HD-GYP domain-containing protein (c-di-GMP phosphodiesterase class II)
VSSIHPTTGASALRTPLARSGTGLVGRVRSLAAARLPGRAEAVGLVIALGFAVSAIAAWIALPSAREFHLGTALLLIVAYAVVDQVSFEVGSAYVFPTELILVPMAVLLPARTLPVVVAAAILLARVPRVVRGEVSVGRLPVVTLGSAWYSLGPALVLAAAGDRSPALEHWPLYAGALGAQFALDLAVTALWARVAYGVPPRSHARESVLAFSVDAALAPIGLAFALLADQNVAVVLFVLPLVLLLGYFARERQGRIDHAIELSHAYRGTALLLGDVIEADDEYTGNHSRDVVELVVAVCDRLDLPEGDRRDAEFTALLHDVGKVKIPAEIINKPGPLDDEERALMKLHTIEGERMLEQVGGLLGRVGKLVRSCHEHYDGSGYPDGIAGEDIPLVARIVCCCDAFNAMTTDRSYRKALPLDHAVAELRRCSGTQFDPAVVEALVAVVG